ncbi:MAG: BamA/TamA family outer membrane protein [Candidatus Eisenbacteria bacterium]|nr:BamA/TamA family outer membrane protein [Candidatus Eisenbacteria bacterium]
MRTSDTRTAVGRLLAALCAAALLALSAAEAAAVEVLGARTVAADEVATILAPALAALPDTTELAERVDSLLALLAAAGRPLAAVAVSWDEPAGAVRVALDEGPAARLDTLTLRGAASPGAAAALERGGLRPGALLTNGAVARGVDELLEMYAASGRPLASVRPAGAARRRDGFALTLAVDEGPLVRFGEVVVSGNTVTGAAVVARAAGIQPGATYDAGRVARVRRRLEKLGLFRSVGDPVVAFDRSTGRAVVGVRLSEAPSSRVTGVLGYDASGAAGDEGEVTGFVDVVLRNIAGTGRSAAAAWARTAPGRTRASFSYTEPWVLGSPVDLTVSGAQTVRDTLYTTTEGDLRVAARMGERTTVAWTVGGARYAPAPSYGRGASSARTALGAEFDATDVPVNPTRGARLAGGVAYAAKKEGDTGRRERAATFTLSGDAFVPARPRHVVALLAQLAAVSSTEDAVPFHEQLVLGGARSLRGYREEQFRGTRTALGTVEYRLILTRRSRALAFLDAGYYYRGGANAAKGVKLGYGIGLRADTRLGIMSLDYGLGEGDRPLEGKLHVGLSREF